MIQRPGTQGNRDPALFKRSDALKDRLEDIAGFGLNPEGLARGTDTKWLYIVAMPR